MDKKEYHRQKSREWYQKNKARQLKTVQKNTKALKARNREFVYRYLLDHPCMDCGEADPVVLEFDHLRDKKHNISDLIYAAWSIENLESEIEKCQVVCCNCHRRRTAKRASWNKLAYEARSL